MEPDLSAYIGLEAEPPRVSRYPVNGPMIRNWVEAHGDLNPVYVDDAAARASGRAGTICPPAMVSTWVMSGYRRYREVQGQREAGAIEDFAYSQMMRDLDSAGYSSVVATNVDQEYLRELMPGDLITCHFTIESISEPKRTGLGDGRFITLLKRYVDQTGEAVARERFRLLRFRPRGAA